MTSDLASRVGAKFQGVGLFGNKPQGKAGKEDKEAELETLRNVKTFLTAKLKQNEEVTYTLQKDIGILKEILRVEKGITQKTVNQLQQKTAELKEVRQQALD